MRAVILLSLFSAAFAVPRQATRIVNGSPITIDQYPFMSNMQYHYWGIIWDQACGGTLLTSATVLSAAHCYYASTETTTTPSPPTSTASSKETSYVSRDAASQWRVRLGTSYATSGGTVHQVLQIIVHEDYNEVTLDNDVAIIRLATRAILGDNVFIARIAGPNYNLPDNTIVTTLGWGALQSGGALPEQLHRVDLVTVNHQVCVTRYAFLKTQPGNQYLPDVTNAMLCTGTLSEDPSHGSKNACEGDFGGPLVHDSDIVIGITSWSYGCADEYYPGVSTRVSSYSDWIVANGSS